MAAGTGARRRARGVNFALVWGGGRGFNAWPFVMVAADFFALPPSLVSFAAHFDACAAPLAWIKGIAPALAGLLGNTAGRVLPPGCMSRARCGSTRV